MTPVVGDVNSGWIDPGTLSPSVPVAPAITIPTLSPKTRNLFSAPGSVGPMPGETPGYVWPTVAKSIDAASVAVNSAPSPQGSVANTVPGQVVQITPAAAPDHTPAILIGGFLLLKFLL